MEFWGVEVKAGQPLKVEIDDRILHLSQATLGEAKNAKGNESIPIFLNIAGQKLVIGTLSQDKSHISYDLVFEKDFELSHNWKNGSVYFCGYKSAPEVDSEEESESSDDEEGLPLIANKENGKPEVTANAGKAASSEAKAKVKIVEPSKDDKSKNDDSDEDDSDDSEDGLGEDDSSDEEMGDASDDSDEEDDADSSDEEDEETPKKPEQSKKRAADSATKTPVEKKAKLVTPQKTGGDGKKGSGGHTATPHPAKKAAAKTPASDKSKQSPKSAASVTCGSCSKTFNSDKALDSHSKAKHSAAK